MRVRHNLCRYLICVASLLASASVATAQQRDALSDQSDPQHSSTQDYGIREQFGDRLSRESNPLYMQHYGGRQLRHNAYQRARLEGMQIRLQQELVSAEVARVRSQSSCERRFYRLKLPGSAWPVTPSSRSQPAQRERTDAASVPPTLGLTATDVDAIRQHMAALGEIRVLRHEELLRRRPSAEVSRPAAAHLDRQSGHVTWPALMHENPAFAQELVELDRLFAQWAQGGHDPTSTAAIHIRKTVGRLTQRLLVLWRDGIIDNTAYTVTQKRLESLAYETQFSEGRSTEDITDALATSH